jgi:hypothetical protein
LVDRAGSKRIRVLTAIVPPPAGRVARLLGERLRATSFCLVIRRRHLQLTWLLVVAARESGRLKRLIAELTPLVEDKIPTPICCWPWPR